MTQSNNPWRDKYRSALNQQEQLEKTLAAQQALLHRAVSVLGDAAKGQDKALDERLLAIAGSLKKNDVAGFDRMLKSLPGITEDADKRQHSQAQDINKKLAAIATQLHKNSTDSDTKAALKRYKKQLGSSSPIVPVTLQRLLDELEQLQAQVITAIPVEKTGFMDKLFNNKRRTEKTSAETPAIEKNILHEEPDIEEPKSTKAVASSTAPISISDNDVAAETDNFINSQWQRNVPQSVLSVDHHQEPAFSAIADRVTVVLTELLDHFPTVPCVEQKAITVRERIQTGLHWYELVPTLEDIRDFVIQAYLESDNDYRSYLNSVYAELNNITSALGIAIESEQRQRLAGSNLHDHMSNSVDTLNQALSQHQEIDSLKQAVAEQMQSLQLALDKFTQEQPTDDNALSAQLTALVERVKKMEQHENDIRQQLEEEKIRATTDSLTELPNREAYSEKIYHEEQRWQRYKHPLSLAVLDIDFFKKINDNYGHQTGDKVLKLVANYVAKQLRSVDFIARFGGEEFIIILPETPADGALLLLNRIRESIAQAAFRYSDEKITITVSIGITEFIANDTADSAFVRADKALYDAKQNGRNQCCAL